MTVLLVLAAPSANAEQVKVLVAPMNEVTLQSSYSVYRNITEYIANDAINELNKNSRFNVPDTGTAEEMLVSVDLSNNYKNFLKKYKDTGTVDYKTCGYLYRKLGFDKVLVVTSAISFQNMILKQPFLYKIGMTEIEPVKSFYRLNVEMALIDTETGIVDFKNIYQKLINTKDFESPAGSISDNVVSSTEIKIFSEEIAKETALKVFVETSEPVFSRVKSNVISTTNSKVQTREGTQTRDGHSYSTNNEFIKKKKEDSYKKWVKTQESL